MSKAVIVYWSGTGNTEAMANAMAKGMKEGGAEANVFTVAEAGSTDLASYEKIALGCPSMGDEVLEESEFEPFIEATESLLNGKKVALFGSYGWGDGQWMRDWVQRTKACGAILYGEGLIVQEALDEAQCVAYGKQFAGF